MGFAESLEVGEVGEFVVWNALLNNKGIRTIVDVRNDKRFQRMDVDFLIEDYHRQYTWIEVKTDYQAHLTHNLAYELTTSQNIGCFEKTQADVIAYYIPKAKVIYFLNKEALKRCAHSGYKEIRMGDNATGVLIPLDDLKRLNVITSTESVKYEWMD